jgi:hypothetical protein
VRFIYRFSAVCCLTALIVFMDSVSLWAAAKHEEASVEFDSAMTLPALLDITLKRHPGSGVIRAGQLTAEAEAKYGRYWIPEMAEISGFHLSDRQLDDIGAYENEVSLSVPFWLPGEKKAQTLLGEATATAQVSRDSEFRWNVSAVLRNRLWSLHLARRQWELALEQEQRLGVVLEQVGELHDELLNRRAILKEVGAGVSCCP